MTDRFTLDNTGGYSMRELAELNRRYETAVQEACPDPDDLYYKSTLDHIAERVEAKFNRA
jgi:hypothetical protein